MRHCVLETILVVIRLRLLYKMIPELNEGSYKKIYLEKKIDKKNQFLNQIKWLYLKQCFP